MNTALYPMIFNRKSFKRGQEYCILLYSESKDNCLQNIGYMGGTT